MPIDPIRDKNFKLLDSLKSNERVGIDSKGRLYKRSGLFAWVTRLTNFIRKSSLHSVVDDYAVDALAKKEFHEIKSESKEYAQLMTKLSSLKLFSHETKANIATKFYNQRYDDLVKSGMKEEVAESIVTIEMSTDPNVSDAMKSKISPKATNGGMSGSYFIKDRKGKNIAIFKPRDEDVFMPNAPTAGDRRGFNPDNPKRHQLNGQPQGVTWLKEVAAWEIDKGQSANVPFTTAITVPFPTRGRGTKPILKKGSLQMFVAGKGANEMLATEVDVIPTKEIQKMAAFDLLIGNGDRHEGNFMWDKSTQTLSLIDHDSAFLDSLDWKEGLQMSEGRFEWWSYTQVGIPTDPEVKDWILNYDLKAKCQILEELGVSEGSIREHRLRVLFVQEGVRQGASLSTLAIMSMESKGERARIDRMVQATLNKVKDPQDEPEFYIVFQQEVTEFFSPQPPTP
ncbi:MAG: hypothetical protein K1000chlam4_00279 [Chlamydiae bacterium]|nr:hypothetical protein [Chlamydiota bacterium]